MCFFVLVKSNKTHAHHKNPDVCTLHACIMINLYSRLLEEPGTVKEPHSQAPHSMDGELGRPRDDGLTYMYINGLLWIVCDTEVAGLTYGAYVIHVE